MQWRTRKAAVAVVAVCGLVTGCAGTASGAGPDPRQIDHRNFVYRGACGTGTPGLDTVMAWGEQSTGAGSGDDASRAQVVSSRLVRLGSPAKAYLLVRLQCSVGARTATGWHLLGYDGDRPTDLGIVAAAQGPIDIRAEDGELVVEHSYRTTADRGLSDSGRTSYRVAVAGLTPVRLYGDEQVQDVPAQVAGWPADAWRTGIVTLSVGPAGQDPTRALGVQVDTETVLAAEDLARADQACQPVVVRTHTGQRIDAATIEGWSGQGGSRVRLALPSDAPDTSAVARLPGPPPQDLAGLLVPGTGLVPALAHATAAGPVTSAAPADDALGARAGVAPQAVFRDPSAAAVLVGSWSAGGPMRQLPDASVPSDSTCTPS